MGEPESAKYGHSRDIAVPQEVIHLWDTRVVSVLERITDGFVALDQQWRYVYVNHQTEQLLGRRREDLLGKNIWDVYPEEIGTLFYQKYHEAMDTQQPDEFEIFYPQRWYAVHIYPSPEGLSLFYTDITQHKQAEEQLLFNASVAQSITDAVIATDMQNRILSWNKAAETLYGWKEEEVLGKDASVILLTDFPNNPHRQWEEQLQTTGFWKGEAIQRCKDGTSVHILASVSLVKNRAGEILGAVAANRDITEQKELEKRKDEFIEMASHELKTPVTALKGHIQLLQRTFEKQGMREYAQSLATMGRQINKLTKLVEELVDVSTMQTGKIDYTKEPFDFDTRIRDIIDNLQQASPHHTISITGTANNKVIGDKDQLEQVFINLVTNAVKYSPDADRVDVALVIDQDTMTVSVRDYGVGIPKEHQSNIFDRFYRVSPFSDNAYPGLGMGLYISYEIVKAHGGKMWVESVEGKGSIFYVSLPHTILLPARGDVPKV